jgi:hypothetical protein
MNVQYTVLDGYRKRNMTLDEIVDEIIRLIRTRDELGGYFQQEPYKGDFFRLFLAAVDAGLLTPTAPKSLRLDSLISIIGARDPDVFDGETMPGRAQRKPSKDKGHGIDPADSPATTLGSPLVSPGFGASDGPVVRRHRTACPPEGGLRCLSPAPD